MVPDTIMMEVSTAGSEGKTVEMVAAAFESYNFKQPITFILHKKISVTENVF